MPYVDFLFLGKCRLCCFSVLLVSSNLTLSFSPRVSVATPASEEAIALDAAFISTLGMEKNIFCVILLIFTLLSQVLLLIPCKKPSKYSLDGKTLPHSPFYYINEEVDRI